MRGMAFRRHQLGRAKARALRYLQLVFATNPEWITPLRIGCRATDRMPCSCRMCGNPRRYGGGPTRAEMADRGAQE